MNCFDIFSLTLLVRGTICLPCDRSLIVKSADMPKETEDKMFRLERRFEQLEADMKIKDLELAAVKEELTKKNNDIGLNKLEIENLKNDFKNLKCQSWPVKFETSILQIGEMVCKLKNPERETDKKKHTGSFPKMVLTTAKGTDDNDNVMDWFKDIRNYYAHRSTTGEEYVKNLLNELKESIEVAQGCDNSNILYNLIDKELVPVVLQKIENLRIICLRNEKRRIPHVNRKELNIVLKDIFDIIHSRIKRVTPET